MMERMTQKILSRSAENTHQLGVRLAEILHSGDIIALYATLGGGKTVLTQGICQGLGITDYVTSPTFTLIQEYEGDKAVAHFDFYRLQSLDEIESLGLEMYFDTDTISIIEWAERAEALLPENRINITLSQVQEKGKYKPDLREIELSMPKNRSFPDMSLWLS